ncbi:MAG: response regulator [Thermodesulfobacteriota bacterium]|nr:response regulator [Thermodesulfobacteriota bacterium]
MMAKVEELQKAVESLERRLLKNEKIRSVLMDRVEKSVQSSGGAYTLFETNILLREQIRQRTEELEKANRELAQEISERKRAQKLLEESERKYKKQFEEALDAIVIADAETGILLDCNRAASELVERAKSELLGKHQRILHPGEPAEEAFTSTFRLHLAEKEGEGLETQVVTKDGVIKDVLIKANVLELEGRKLLQGIFHDITNRKRAQEERGKLEAQLRQAQKMEAIGTLAGGIAHDFNNILAALIGYTEMALEDAEEGSLLQQNLGEVLIAGNRAKGLVKQILAFSRQTDQESKPVQIRPIAEEALKLLRATLPATIEIRQDIRSDSAVRANPTHVHQVLINLCTNAGQAMEEKGGTLDVMFVDVVIDADFAHDHPDMEPGPYVKLSVTDTGHGMAPEILERIFDPFFTTRKVGEGTGMGLSVVHGIVTSYGGTIRTYSEPGKGSTFDVYLPIIDRQAALQTWSEQAVPGGTERILFIDDEETLSKMGKRMLESLGYDVTARTDGMEALELFRAQPDRFDLVITDMTMPKVTGADLAKEVMGIRPDIPIVLCTGFSATMDEKRAEAMGIKAFVFKPVLKGEMAMTIRQLLDSQKEKAGQPRPRVLVIDDDVGIRTMLRRLLEGAGYEVTEAPDGNQGIYLYRQDPVDLVITDIIMPEKEGLETIRELRRDFPKVKIVAISGGGRIRADEYLPMAEKFGADRTLAKPFDPKELLDAVHELVG